MPFEFESFETATNREVHRRYRDMCAICLAGLMPVLDKRVYLISRSRNDQIEFGLKKGLIPDSFAKTYNRSSERNRVLCCFMCQIYIQTSQVALSPSPQVLRYLLEYLRTTPRDERKPLYKILEQLDRLSRGRNEDTNFELKCDSSEVIPYLHMFTLVPMRPSFPTSLTSHYPFPSLLTGNHFSLVEQEESTLQRTTVSLQTKLEDIAQAPPNAVFIFDATMPPVISKAHMRFNLMDRVDSTPREYWKLHESTGVEVILVIFMSLVSSMSKRVVWSEIHGECILVEQILKLLDDDDLQHISASTCDEQ
ncbi:hypothetical protein L208DRAFT_1386073 [Tricholoma matsutake]|nr:hypothetical protein L208DRAFT_1386073 [Tricholoma matsutake 945]